MINLFSFISLFLKFAEMSPAAAAKILGISLPASSEDIKAAYKSKAKSLHPDVNPSPNATAQMRDVNLAFSVLKSYVPPPQEEIYSDEDVIEDDKRYYDDYGFDDVDDDERDYAEYRTKKPSPSYYGSSSPNWRSSTIEDLLNHMGKSHKEDQEKIREEFFRKANNKIIPICRKWAHETVFGWNFIMTSPSIKDIEKKIPWYIGEEINKQIALASKFGWHTPLLQQTFKTLLYSSIQSEFIKVRAGK